MKLKTLELEIDRPPIFSAINLRHLVLKELTKYGEPLRWAVTLINLKIIKIEAVVITEEKILNKK